MTKTEKIQQIVAIAQQEQQNPLTQSSYKRFLPVKSQEINVKYLGAILQDWSDQEINYFFDHYVRRPGQKIKKISLFIAFLLITSSIIVGLNSVIHFEMSY